MSVDVTSPHCGCGCRPAGCAPGCPCRECQPGPGIDHIARYRERRPARRTRLNRLLRMPEESMTDAERDELENLLDGLVHGE